MVQEKGFKEGFELCVEFLSSEFRLGYLKSSKYGAKIRKEGFCVKIVDARYLKLLTGNVIDDDISLERLMAKYLII